MLGKSIAKNAAYMTAASVGQKIIAFLYFTLIARTLGAEGTGMYFSALAFTSIFVVFVDLGFSNVLVREAARAKEKAQSFFSTIISVKIFFGLCSYIFMILSAHLLGYQKEVILLIYVSGITMLLDSTHLSMYGILRALGDLSYEAKSIIFSQAITLVLGSAALFMGLPLVTLILAFTVASFINVLYVSFILVKKFNIKLRPKFDKVLFKKLAKIAFPFALAAIFARVYSYIDSVLLLKLTDAETVGWYSVPYKITYAFQFIPLALVAAIYPRYSEFYCNSKQKLSKIFEKSMHYLFFIVFPISVGIGVLAPDIILFLYDSEYISSILPLQILIFSLIFSFVSFPIGAFLNACDRQVTQTCIVGMVMVVNIVLNLILIPYYSLVGAAFAAFIGNALLAIIGYAIVPKITKINHFYIFKVLIKVLVSAFVMGVAVWYVNQHIHFILSIPIGVATYAIMALITRAMPKSELVHVFTLMRK